MENIFFDSTRTMITMSIGMSMANWEQSGIIHRELSYYKELSRHVGKLSFLSYGNDNKTENQLLKNYIPDAQISWIEPSLFDKIPSGHFISSFIPPFYPHSFRSIKCIRSNQISGGWAGAIIAKQLKVPFILRGGYIWSEHFNLSVTKSLIIQKLIFYLESWTAQQADAIIVTYNNAKSFFVRKHGIKPEKIIVIGNPIDTNLFSPIFSVSPHRDILFIGRFTDQKNIPAILKACHKTKSTITLLGKGPLKTEMIKLAESLQLNAIFIEYLPNDQIPQLMAKHRIFILASHFEGNPKALLEAMSCEKPCIVSNIKEHRELIKNGTSGLLVSPTVEGISSGIHQVLKNENFARSLGKHARRKVLDNHTLNKNALKESILHQQVIKNFSKK